MAQTLETLDERRRKLDASILSVAAATLFVLTTAGVLIFGVLGITLGFTFNLPETPRIKL